MNQTYGFTNLKICDDVSLETQVISVSLAGGDVVLTDAQAVAGIIEITTGHAVNAVIVPAHPGKIYIVVNLDGALAGNIKIASGTAVTVALSKSAIVYVNGAGNNVKRLTADA